MLKQVLLWFRDRRIYGPSRRELERLVRSQRHHYLDGWLTGVYDRLSANTGALLEASIADPDGQIGFNAMKGDAGQASLDNILGMTAKLAFIQKLDLPRNLLQTTSKTWVEQTVRRVYGENASEMRRHTPARQIELYAVYLLSREAQLTDAMIDLLVEIVHKISARSKRKVVGDIAKDIERVYGKERLLVEIASASIGEPSGRVCDVIFPIVDKEKLTDDIRHVEKRATCVYSQVIRCSSTEVASIIEGVLRHCTDMEIQRQYVDSHDGTKPTMPTPAHQSSRNFKFGRKISR